MLSLRQRQRRASGKLLRERRLLHAEAIPDLQSDSQWQGNGAEKLGPGSGPVAQRDIPDSSYMAKPQTVKTLHSKRRSIQSKHRAATDYTFSAPEERQHRCTDSERQARHPSPRRSRQNRAHCSRESVRTNESQTRPWHPRKSADRQHPRRHVQARNEPRTRPAIAQPLRRHQRDPTGRRQMAKPIKRRSPE